MIQTESPLNKFSEFAKERKHLIGDKVNLKDILDVPIVVTDFKTDKSKFKTEIYVAIQCHKVGESEPRVVFTGATVLREQLETYQEHILASNTKSNEVYPW